MAFDKLDMLHIEGTHRTPDVLLRGDGLIRIKGRGMRTDRDKVPQSIWDWLESYTKDPAEVTTVILAFEIINPVSTAVLLKQLRMILDVTFVKELVIYWYYEHGDHDMLERGEYFSVSLNFPFTFIETENLHTANYLFGK